MRKWCAAAVLAALVLVSVGVATALAGPAQRVWDPPGDTVVKVTGDAANGFGIFFKDGSATFPPTDSESMAECGEYDTVVARVRCKATVRTRYRDLAQLKRAINWARASSRAG